MKNISSGRIIYLFLLMLAGIFTGCKNEKLVVPNEPTKHITGTWRITNVMQDGIVLYDQRNPTAYPGAFDFSTFRLIFNGSNYTTNAAAPFIVSTDGTYSLDQPFSTKLSFTPKTGSSISLDFYYPVTAGQRQLILTFIPGCFNNSYQYILEKANQ